MSDLYRSITWFFRSYNNSTKSAFEKESKSFNADDLDVDLNGKNFIISGTNLFLPKVQIVD
jgi:hypothetical protein